MEVFVRVAECGSFSRAAESLDLANATVTTCVRNLERHLGVTLIDRDTRRLRLTEEGHIYLRHSRELLQAAAQGDDEVRTRIGELRGWLHVETPISLGHALLCPALPRFARRYPGVCTAVTLTNHPLHMIEGAVDVAVRMDHVAGGELHARPIYESRYVVCCAPPLAAGAPAHPRELDPRRCIGIAPERQRHGRPWSFERAAERVQVQPAGPVHFNSSDALVAAAQAGMGIACVLDVFVRRELDNGTLVRLYPDWTMPSKVFSIVTPAARAGSAKVRAFTDFLVEVLEMRPASDGTEAAATART